MLVPRPPAMRKAMTMVRSPVPSPPETNGGGKNCREGRKLGRGDENMRMQMLEAQHAKSTTRFACNDRGTTYVMTV
jgi:hypothetical protein